MHVSSSSLAPSPMIDSELLQHLGDPGKALIESFISEAVNSEDAEQYFDVRCGPEKVEARRFLEDWQLLIQRFQYKKTKSLDLTSQQRKDIIIRDDNECVISGVPGNMLHPLNIYSVLPLPDLIQNMGSDEFEMLTAFLSPRHLDFLLSTVPSSPYSRHWLLSDAAAKAFHESQIKLVAREGGNKYNVLTSTGENKQPDIPKRGRDARWRLDLIDESKTGLPLPSPVLLDIHARFSKPVQLLKYAESNTSNSSLVLGKPVRTGTSFIGSVKNVFHKVPPRNGDTKESFLDST